jgi:hypothetical protein
MRHHDSDRLARYPSTDMRGIEATYLVATFLAGRLAVNSKAGSGDNGRR